MSSKFIFVLFSFVFFYSCANPFANQSLSMTADPGVTEAWITLHVDGVRSGADYIVQRDGATVFKGRLQSPDTVVYDSLLQPATTYTYRFFAQENGDDSPALQSSLTTMDTTSHNFSWQSYEFGGQNGSSYFQDVAIIDENDIWAVGEIHTDSTDRWNEDGTEWLQPYNAAHWDGQKWELMKIPSIICGNNSPIQSAIFTIFTFSSNDVWFSDGAELIHFNGSIFKQDCSINPLLVGKINKIWGTSDNNLYVVGNSGMIAHYDGKNWTKIGSGTDLPIQDIWGSVNPVNGETEILCVAWLFYRNEKTSNWKNNWVGINHAYILSVSGTDLNNILTCGSFGEIMHYNGKSWRNYYKTTKIAGNYYSLKCYQSWAVAVGENIHSGNIDSRARVLIGKR